MTDQAMLAELLTRLQQTDDPTEKSAIVAEMAFAQLDPLTATIARRCVILRWFDEAVVRAFVEDEIDDPPAGLPAENTAQLADLPFVETLDWGLAYHEQTRAGLLERAIERDVDFLRRSAGLAASAYLEGGQRLGADEALYTLVVAGQSDEATALLDAMLSEAGRREDWQGFAAIFANLEAAEAFSFVHPFDLSANHYLARGLARSAQGDLDATIRDYDQAIALNPDDASAYNSRGVVRQVQGSLDAAIADYDQAIILNPDYAYAFYNRGNAHSDQGNFVAAIADYDQTIALYPEYAPAYNNRGLVRQAQGDFDAAIADYDVAAALNPDYYAIAFNDRAVVHDPKDAIPYNNLGTALRSRQRWAEAEAAHRRAIELDPYLVDNWIALADIARRDGDKERWKRAVDSARPLVDTTDKYNTACFESIAGNIDVALDLLEESLREQPDMVPQAKADPDLHWIRHNPRFDKIIRNVESDQHDNN